MHDSSHSLVSLKPSALRGHHALSMTVPNATHISLRLACDNFDPNLIITVIIRTTNSTGKSDAQAILKLLTSSKHVPEALSSKHSTSRASRRTATSPQSGISSSPALRSLATKPCPLLPESDFQLSSPAASCFFASN